MKKQSGNSMLAFFLFVWIVGSWLTHIVVCLGAGKWGFLIAGAIFFPVAVVHGTGIWFGVF
jgi:hypothetical protein